MLLTPQRFARRFPVRIYIRVHVHVSCMRREAEAAPPLKRWTDSPVSHSLADRERITMRSLFPQPFSSFFTPSTRCFYCGIRPFVPTAAATAAVCLGCPSIRPSLLLVYCLILDFIRISFSLAFPLSLSFSLPVELSSLHYLLLSFRYSIDGGDACTCRILVQHTHIPTF